MATKKVHNPCIQASYSWMGRDCAECGIANYWSVSHQSCLPCPYESGYCTEGFPCCNDDGPRYCTKSFELIDGECKCRRGEGFRYKHECVCPEDNTYTDGNGNCFECENRCHGGCEKFECGDGFYLEKDGCRCLPVHYSCKNGTGPKVADCIECKDDFKMVKDDDDLFYCFCDGCLIEINHGCVPVDPATDSSKVCSSCPRGQFLYQGKCKCIDDRLQLVDGKCIA